MSTGQDIPALFWFGLTLIRVRVQAPFSIRIQTLLNPTGFQTKCYINKEVKKFTAEHILDQQTLMTSEAHEKPPSSMTHLKRKIS